MAGRKWRHYGRGTAEEGSPQAGQAGSIGLGARAQRQHPRTGIWAGPPGRASGRGPQDIRAPGTGIWERPPGPPRPQDGHLGGAPRTAAPPGWASGWSPQDCCAPGTGIRAGPPGPPHPQDGHPGGTPRTAATLGRASRWGPQDHHDPGEAGSCPSSCLCPPAQALVLTQLLCSSS